MRNLLILFVLLVLSSSYALECQADFNLVSHAMGESCVPQNPQRVLVLDTGELDGVSFMAKPRRSTS